MPATIKRPAQVQHYSRFELVRGFERVGKALARLGRADGRKWPAFRVVFTVSVGLRRSSARTRHASVLCRPIGGRWLPQAALTQLSRKAQRAKRSPGLLPVHLSSASSALRKCVSRRSRDTLFVLVARAPPPPPQPPIPPTSTKPPARFLPTRRFCPQARRDGFVWPRIRQLGESVEAPGAAVRGRFSPVACVCENFLPQRRANSSPLPADFQ